MKSLSKKKVALLGVGAALCLATAASFGAMSMGKASAASVTGDQGTATVTYPQASSWTIKIPDTITVGSPVQIEASDVNTVNGLTITVNSANEFKLKNGAEEIDYELKVAEADSGLSAATALQQGGTVLTVSGDSGSTYIGAYVEGTPSTGGEAYTDTLTFHIAEN